MLQACCSVHTASLRFICTGPGIRTCPAAAHAQLAMANQPLSTGTRGHAPCLSPNSSLVWLLSIWFCFLQWDVAGFLNKTPLFSSAVLATLSCRFSQAHILSLPWQVVLLTWLPGLHYHIDPLGLFWEGKRLQESCSHCFTMNWLFRK